MRGRGLLVVGALALVALVLPAVALVSALGTDRPAPSVAGVDLACAIEGDLGCDTDVKPVPVLPLEAGPVALLVCADGGGSTPWTAPTDLVEADLSRLRAVLDGLEEAPAGDVACTRQGGPAYDLVLRFSRDRYARVHGDTSGCGFVTVASGRWFGAGEVFDTALSLVEQQRGDRPVPTALPEVPGCPAADRGGPPYSLTGSAVDMVVAVSCSAPDAPEPPPPGPAVRVPTRALEVLTADLAARAEPLGRGGRYDCPGGDDALYYQVLVGRTAWGDLVSVAGQCHEFVLGDQVWYPSPRAQRILDGLRR